MPGPASLVEIASAAPEIGEIVSRYVRKQVSKWVSSAVEIAWRSRGDRIWRTRAERDVAAQVLGHAPVGAGRG